MADPVARSALKIGQKSLTFVSRFMGCGGCVVPEGMDDLQRAIDDPNLMRHFVQFAQAGYPDLAALTTALAPLAPFAESASHRAARDILGVDFIGLETARCVYKNLLTDEHVKTLQEIRLFDESRDTLRSQKDSMDILHREAVYGKRRQFLFPCLPVSVPSLHAVDPMRFEGNRVNPWFSEAPERRHWSDKHPKLTCWILMDRDIFPDSWDKNIKGQQGHVLQQCPECRLTQPWEYVPGALLYQAATGVRICSHYWVRFSVQTSLGDWVGAYWKDMRLGLTNLHALPVPNFGSCALRAS